MSTPQDPPRRRKQKARRTKQLVAWRAKNNSEKAGATNEKGAPGNKKG